MNSPHDYVLVTVALIGTKLLYLRAARHFGLFDKPNERSSHTDLITIRAGGVLFYLAVLAATLINDLNLPYFFTGLSLVALISFWDDLSALPIRYRSVTQFISVGLLLLQIELFPDQSWLFFGSMVVGVGILNAHNFMDGVNGMTVFYSLVTIGTLWYLTSRMPDRAYDSLFPFIVIALIIFGYFNARRRAVCFAGDVGSISIGFISLYILTEAIKQNHTYLPMLFLAIYGADSVLTLVHRLYLRQNILQAHRMHLFQLLAHQRQWPHLHVSALYALTQLGINILVLIALDWSLAAQSAVAFTILSILSILYIVLKRRLTYSQKEGRLC